MATSIELSVEPSVRKYVSGLDLGRVAFMQFSASQARMDFCLSFRCSLLCVVLLVVFQFCLMFRGKA